MKFSRKTLRESHFYLLTLCSFFCLRCAQGQATTVVSAMDDGLLDISDILPEDTKSYDKMRPPRSNNNATVVYFHVTVMSLDSIDESSMTYAADIFFAQSWKDPRLRFPKNMTGEYRLLPVSWLQDIWRPDSFFKNAKSVIFQTMTIPNHYVWLYKDSTILYMVKLTLLLSCAMTFQSYPHDTQQCFMKIESLSHTTADLIFIWDPLVPLVVDDSIELPQLDLVSNTTGDCTQLYSTGNFTCLEVSFTFKRRLGYYLFHTYVPTCLIVIMSWISFWIKPEAVPARVTLGVTSLLTLSTQHANSQKSLPPVSYIKAIDMFMSSCTVFVFLSLMEYAVVNVILGDMVEVRKQQNLRQRIMGKLNRNSKKRRNKATLANITTNADGATTAQLNHQTGNSFNDSTDYDSDTAVLDSQLSPKCSHCNRKETTSCVSGIPQNNRGGIIHNQIIINQQQNKHTSPTYNQIATIKQPGTVLSQNFQKNTFSNSPTPPSVPASLPNQNRNSGRCGFLNRSESSCSARKYQPHHHSTWQEAENIHHCSNSNKPPQLKSRHNHRSKIPPTSLSPLSFYPHNIHDTGNDNGSTPNIAAKSFAIEMREARAKAILVDRFSRVFFPLSFTILNILYWYVYFEW